VGEDQSCATINERGGDWREGEDENRGRAAATDATSDARSYCYASQSANFGLYKGRKRRHAINVIATTA